MPVLAILSNEVRVRVLTVPGLRTCELRTPVLANVLPLKSINLMSNMSYRQTVHSSCQGNFFFVTLLLSFLRCFMVFRSVHDMMEHDELMLPGDSDKATRSS